MRKKQFYKEAIRVEVIPSNAQSDAKEPGFDDWLKWDPISSGEGDLLLDEMAKSFSAATNTSTKAKAIDFASVVESLTSHGLQIKDIVSVTEPEIEPPQHGNVLASAQGTVAPVAAFEVPKKVDKLDLLREEHHPSLYDIPAKDQTPSHAGSKILSTETVNVFSKFEKGVVNHAPSTDIQTKVSNGLDALLADHESEVADSLQNHTSACGTSRTHVTADTLRGFTNARQMCTEANQTEEHHNSANRLDVCLGNHEAEAHHLQPQSGIAIFESSALDALAVHTLRKDTELAHACIAVGAIEPGSSSENLDSAGILNEDSKRSNSSNVVLDSADVVLDTISNEADTKFNDVTSVENVTLSKVQGSFTNEECKGSVGLDLVLDTPDALLDEASSKMDVKLLSKRKREQFRETEGDSITHPEGSSLLEYHNMLVKETDCSVSSYQQIADVEDKKQTENQFGMKYPTSEKSAPGNWP